MCVCVCVWADRGAHVLTAGLCYSNAGRGCTGLLERSPSCLLVTLRKGAYCRRTCFVLFDCQLTRIEHSALSEVPVCCVLRVCVCVCVTLFACSSAFIVCVTPDPAQLAVVLFVGCTCSSSLCALYHRKAPSAVKQCLCFCCDCA